MANRKSPPVTTREMLETLASDLSVIIGDEALARTALSSARDAASTKGVESIRAISQRLSQVNVTLDEDEQDELLGLLVEKAEHITGYEMKPARKSELKTLIGQARNLPAIIVDLDKRRAKDPKSSFNLREKTIAAARRLRDDSTITVKEAVGMVVKAPLTNEERVRALTERLRKEVAFRVKVGDESMVDPDAEQLLKGLDDLLDGVRPTPVEDTPEYQALEAQLEGLRAQLANTEDLAEVMGDAIVEAASNNWGAPVEGPGGPQDGDSDEEPSTTMPEEKAAPVASSELQKAKQQAVTPGLTGYASIDDLMNDLTGFKG